MSAISDNLLHFLGRSERANPSKQFEIFTSIIENGLRLSPEVIQVGTGWMSSHVVCFTDIPLSECSEHTSTYGKFAIGFKKSFIKRSGGNPVFYFNDFQPIPATEGNPETRIVAARGAMLLNLSGRLALLQSLKGKLGDDFENGLFDSTGNNVLTGEELRNLLACDHYCGTFLKPIGDLGPARDESTHVDLYYKEREWRVTPSTLALIAGLITEKTDGNEKNSYHLSFNRSDINVIVVPNEEVRHRVMHYFLSTKNPSYTESIPPVVNYDELNMW